MLRIIQLPKRAAAGIQMYRDRRSLFDHGSEVNRRKSVMQMIPKGTYAYLTSIDRPKMIPSEMAQLFRRLISRPVSAAEIPIRNNHESGSDKIAPEYLRISG